MTDSWTLSPVDTFHSYNEPSSAQETSLWSSFDQFNAVTFPSWPLRLTWANSMYMSFSSSYQIKILFISHYLWIHLSIHEVLTVFLKSTLENTEIWLWETAAKRWPPQLKAQAVQFLTWNSLNVLMSSMRRFIKRSLSEKPARMYIPEKTWKVSFSNPNR